MSPSRRALLRSVGAAVVAASGAAAGRGADRHDPTAADAGTDVREDQQTHCEPPEDGYPAVEGFVFHPESYRACAPFRIRAVSREFETSVGPGPIACHRLRRAYVAYGISYENVELGPDEGVEGGAGNLDSGLSTFLAVEVPGKQERPLPHDYFRGDQLFQFVATGDEVVFHTECSEPTTPVQEATFDTVD